jgi:bifunctional enzyme CysN/CysC
MSLEAPSTTVDTLSPQNSSHKEQLSFVIVGHVDHGKSTVVGRLLADTNSLPEGKLEAIRASCARNSKPFEYAFLLDALKDEQAQGITIDISRTFFHTETRNYTIIDAPGHIEFLKNMITGAAHAEAAFLTIDAKEGIQENSRRHGYMLAMLGIKQFYVLINKMDLVDYSEQVYKDISLEYSEFLGRVGCQPIDFIPVSAFNGDNIVRHSEKMPWYKKETILSALDKFVKEPSNVNKPLRVPVQDVYKFTNEGDDRRIVTGLIESGRIAVGDEVVFYPSNKRAHVKSIEGFNVNPRTKLEAGKSVGVTLNTQIYVTRGEIMVKATEPAPHVSSEIKVNLFWMGKTPLTKDKTYKLKVGTQEAQVKVKEVVHVLNASNLSMKAKEQVERHEVAEVILETFKPVAFDLASENETLGRFVLVDNYEIAGGGIIVRNEGPIADPNAYNNAVTAEEREKRYKVKSKVIWITGPKPSLKKELAKIVERKLFDMGKNPIWIDSEDVRSGLSSDLNSSDSNRSENVRRIAEMAALLRREGFVVIITAISPYLDYRKNAKLIIGDEHFYEIDVLDQRSPIYQANENADMIINHATLEELGELADKISKVVIEQ